MRNACGGADTASGGDGRAAETNLLSGGLPWCRSLAQSLRRRTTILVVILGFLTLPFVVVPAPPAAAYNVCSDDGAPCVHEYMAAVPMFLYNTTEILAYAGEIQAGATHEDEIDHVFGLAGVDGAVITITHFWDADDGPGDQVHNIFGDFPNAWQKIQALWSQALGAYAKGDKARAYHWLGHVVHLIGDATIPTHVHNDMHGPDWYDDDSYEEWMSLPSGTPGVPSNAKLTADEVNRLDAQGPLPIPSGAADKLHYLLYSTNQIADFFASEGGLTEFGSYDGDTVCTHADCLLKASPEAESLQEELTRMATSITSPRVSSQLNDNDFGNDNDDGDLGRIREFSYLRGLRAIASVYELFTETVTEQLSMAVVIEHVEEDKDHDYVCVPHPLIPFEEICVETTDPDFYAKVVVGGRAAQNRGDAVDGDEVIDPGWAFGTTTGLTGSVPIHLEIWDDDGDEDDLNPFGTGDDHSDIDPTDEEADRTLDLSVDVAKCLSGATGAITGEAGGSCGTTLISTGDRDVEASQVRFRVIMSKSPPTAKAGGPYATTEGVDVALNGTGSTDPDNDIVRHAWDLDGDGSCDDVVDDPSPFFTAVGQDGVTTVKLCVTDATGMTDEDTAVVTVTNVAPTIDLASDAPKGENTAVTVTGTIRDPGWLDLLSATIAWGDGGSPVALTGVSENDRPNSTLTFSASHTYGDNGLFTAQVCAADDDTTPCTSIALQVDNTNPTPTIDLSGAVAVNGVPTVIAHAGQAVAFDGRATDPGSDDLVLRWAWGDGTADASMSSLVNPPNPDPAPSPSIQPRDLRFAQSHTFSAACAYEAAFDVTDDDAGTATSRASVIIVGNGHPNQSHGWWKQQVRPYATGKGTSDFTAGELSCYLRIAGHMSRVFSETTAATTFAAAYDVLDVSRTSVMTELFDLQLLAAWLNFANGAIEWNRLVDTNNDRIADTRFLDAMTAAEALRLNPASTRAQLERQKMIVEGWTKLP